MLGLAMSKGFSLLMPKTVILAQAAVYILSERGRDDSNEQARNKDTTLGVLANRLLWGAGWPSGIPTT
jgi:hypothetical protein